MDILTNKIIDIGIIFVARQLSCLVQRQLTCLVDAEMFTSVFA